MSRIIQVVDGQDVCLPLSLRRIYRLRLEVVVGAQWNSQYDYPSPFVNYKSGSPKS